MHFLKVQIKGRAESSKSSIRCVIIKIGLVTRQILVWHKKAVFQNSWPLFLQLLTITTDSI